MSLPIVALDEPDVAAYGKLVDALCGRLDSIRTSLKTLYGIDGATNLDPLKAYAAAGDEITTMSCTLQAWYPLHADGQDVTFLAALRALAGEFRVQMGKAPTGGKLATVLLNSAEVLETHIAMLTKTNTAYLLASTSVAAKQMPTWLATHLPKTRPMETYFVLNRMGKERAPIHFGNFVKRLTAEKKEAKVDLGALGAQLEKTIRSAKCLTKYVGGVKEGIIAGSLQLHRDDDFTSVYVRDFLSTNAETIRLTGGDVPARVLPVSEVDNVIGFQSGATIFLRPESDLSTRVHESLHLMTRTLTKSQWKKQFGCVLEEAAAEYVCSLVCAELDIAFKLDGYYNNVTLLKLIMKQGKLTDQMIIDAYLGGKTTPVERAIIDLSGEAGLAILVNSKETLCYDTYNSWVEQWRKHEKENETCVVS